MTEQGHSAVSSLPLTLVRPRTGGSRTAPTVARAAGRGGRSLAWARVARLCVYFKRDGENAGLGRTGGEKWRRREDYVGRARGWMGQWRERVARESDGFLGARGANGLELGEGARPGCTSDRPRDTGLAQWRTQRELYTVLDRGEG